MLGNGVMEIICIHIFVFEIVAYSLCKGILHSATQYSQQVSLI